MGYFIQRKDFFPFITPEDLTRVTADDDTIWQANLPAVIEYLRGKIGHRYDTTKVFEPIETYDNSEAYEIGDRVDNAGVLYYAIQAVPALTSINDTDYWTQGDSRNAMVMQCVVEVSLYNIYSRLNGTDIPAFIEKRFERCMDYMKGLQEGTDDVNLPLQAAVEDGTDTSGDSVMLVTSEIATDKYNSI